MKNPSNLRNNLTRRARAARRRAAVARRRTQHERGFSLIELLIVVAIIGIIAAIAIPNLLASRRAANEAAAVSAIRTLTTAEEAYHATYGGGARFGLLDDLVTKKFIDQVNMEILTSKPEDFAAYQKSEQERWFKVIKENDIKGD